MAVFQATHIAGFIIRGAVLPAAEQNAYPFEGQGAYRSMVPLAQILLALVESLRPAS